MGGRFETRAMSVVVAGIELVDLVVEEHVAALKDGLLHQVLEREAHSKLRPELFAFELGHAAIVFGSGHGCVLQTGERKADLWERLDTKGRDAGRSRVREELRGSLSMRDGQVLGA